MRRLSIIALLAPAAAYSSGQRDACGLLERKEIATVQGEAPKEIKPSQRTEGALQIFDCVFVLPTYAKSISLEVTRGSKNEVRQRWKQIFRSEGGRENEPDSLKPEAVRGLGDEAFWVPESPSGALYVLRRKSFLRLSIGGPGSREAKVERAAALARKALLRL